MTELISSFAGAAKASEGAVAAPPAPAAEACESHWLVGQHLLAEHKPFEARHHLLEAYRLDPRSCSVCRALGKTYLASSELIRAKLWFEAAIAIDSSDARPWCDLGLLELGGGQPETAIALFDQALHRDASYFPAWGGLATARGILQEHGPCLEAAEEALRLHPSLANLHTLRGVALEQLGRPQEAEGAYAEELARYPAAVEPLNRLVALLQGQGKLQEAIEVIDNIVARRPETADDALILAELHQLRGQLREAEEALRRALALAPDNVLVSINLSSVLSQRHRTAEARAVVEQLLERDPFLAEAHLNLGYILLEDGQLKEAEQATRRALALAVSLSASHQAKAHMNLGCILARRGRNQEAMAAERQAIALDPDLADAHYNLGMLLQQSSNFAEAVIVLERLLALQDDHGPAALCLGHAYREQGRYEQAELAYAQAAELLPNELLPALSCHLSLVPTVIAPSVEAIAASRLAYRKGIDAISHPPLAQRGCSGIALSNGCLDVFWLAYHNHTDDKEILEALAKALRGHPALRPWMEHASPKASRQREGPLRLGICSEYLVRHHTMGKQYAGLIQGCAQAGLHTVVLTPIAVHQDAAHQEIATSASEAVPLPAREEEAAAVIRALDLDVLFYPDIGMSPLTYLLALARLAPVQVSSWGHPVTSGSPCMDYFLSSALLEPEGAQAHYSEQLVCLSRIPTIYPSLEPLPPVDPRTSFALDTHAHVPLPEEPFWIGIPQTLFKFHPDFDATLEAIASAIPSAVFVLLEGHRPHWCEALKQRWQHSAPQVFHRSVFLPQLSRERYLQLVDAMDLLLDTFYFGGGNTFYEAMASGTPTVTMPGRAMRGRVVAGAYQQMGVADAPIANSPQEYVAWCGRLAADPHLRRDLKQRLRAAAASRLFNDTAILKEYLEFFQAATAASHRGEKLPPGWSPTPSPFPALTNPA